MQNKIKYDKISYIRVATNAKGEKKMKIIQIVTNDKQLRDLMAQDCAKQGLEFHIIEEETYTEKLNVVSLFIVGNLCGFDTNNFLIRRSHYTQTYSIKWCLSKISDVLLLEC